MNLSIETINFHVQEYRDVTLNTKLGKKLRHTNFWHKFGFLGHFFAPPPGPQLSEYVWVVCRNKKGTCLKSVSKTPTFRFFRDSQPLKEAVAHIQPNGQFWTVFGQNGRNGIFFKKGLGTFFLPFWGLTNCQVSAKVMNGFWESPERTDERMNGRMNERTRAKFKVLTN